jgi:protein-disulfide isomerase
MEESSKKNIDEVSTSQLDDSSHIAKKESRGLHGPSLGIGAGIAIVSIISAFLAVSMIDNNPELQFEENSPKPGAVGDSMALFTSNAAISLGSDDAPITLVEFGDYQCFFCNKFFHETEPSILENYVKNGQVKIIFKDFTIIGPDSIGAAHATHCANDQGKYWEYHDELYKNWGGENNGWASSENLVKFAQNIDLNEEVFKKCMSDGKYQQLVSASSNDARNLGITGTPAFFVIGPDNQITRISGAQPYDVFHNVFQGELQK